MADEELLRRIDRQLDLCQQEIALSRETHDDLRVFIRDQNTRMDRILEGFGARFEDMGARFDRMSARLDRMGARLEDQGEQIRANTRAVLLVLDRLEGEGRTGSNS